MIDLQRTTALFTQIFTEKEHLFHPWTIKTKDPLTLEGRTLCITVTALGTLALANLVSWTWPIWPISFAITSIGALSIHHTVSAVFKACLPLERMNRSLTALFENQEEQLPRNFSRILNRVSRSFAWSKDQELFDSFLQSNLFIIPVVRLLGEKYCEYQNQFEALTYLLLNLNRHGLVTRSNVEDLQKRIDADSKTFFTDILSQINNSHSEPSFLTAISEQLGFEIPISPLETLINQMTDHANREEHPATETAKQTFYGKLKHFQKDGWKELLAPFSEDRSTSHHVVFFLNKFSSEEEMEQGVILLNFLKENHLLIRENIEIMQKEIDKTDQGELGIKRGICLDILSALKKHILIRNPKALSQNFFGFCMNNLELVLGNKEFFPDVNENTTALYDNFEQLAANFNDQL